MSSLLKSDPRHGFGTPKRYRTLRRLLRDRPPTRVAGFRDAPVLVRLPALTETPAPKPAVRIYLGTEPLQYRAERVFIWSILKHRDPARSYEVYLMKDLAGFTRGRWTTGFTNYRYGIPWMAGEGRAIYNDVDQIYLDDPGKLYDLPLVTPDGKPAALLAIDDAETSVMLMDCDRLKSIWSLEAAQTTRNHPLFRSQVHEAGAWGLMPGRWNARDYEYEEGRSGLLHYTILYKQPWHPFPEEYRYQPNDNAGLWDALEAEADAANYTVFTAQEPTDAYRALRQQGPAAIAAGPLDLKGQHFHQQKLGRLAAQAGARTFGELGGSGLAQALPKDRVIAVTPLLPEDGAPFTERLGRADGLYSIDLLHHLPEDDIPWVLEELFARADRFVYVGVPVFDTPEEGSAASCRAPLPLKWWRGQLELTARRHPGIRYALAYRQGNGGDWRLA